MKLNGHPDKQQYVSDEVLDARYFKALDRFDIRFAPTMWVYDNVRAGTEVLHVGCGAGMLALLKRKGLTLTGIDTSNELALTARRNGYDATSQANFSSLPFANETFDYVVSFDLLSRIGDSEQTAILAEMKRVLRPDGVTLHTIECDETVKDTDHAARFLRFFQHVAMEPRYALCLGVEGFLEQAERSEAKLEKDFLDYVRDLSFKERRAFDLAMGYVFSQVSDLGIQLPPNSSHIFLKAADTPLGPFYNEHRDRRALFSINGSGRIEDGVWLDRNSETAFDDDWYEPVMLPPIGRWMGKRGRIRFHADTLSAVSLDLTTQLPDLIAKPLGLELSLNGVRLCAFTLYKHGWLQLSIQIPEGLSAKADGEFELELRANRTAQSPDDDRELSIAVCNIEVRTACGSGRANASH